MSKIYINNCLRALFKTSKSLFYGSLPISSSIRGVACSATHPVVAIVIIATRYTIVHIWCQLNYHCCCPLTSIALCCTYENIYRS